MVDGRRNILQYGSRKTDSTNNSLGLIEVAFQGEQESVVFVAAQGTGERALVVFAMLRRLRHGEGVSGVKDGIAKQEVEGAVKIVRAGFGGDFETRVAGIGEKRGVRVLVDFDFMNAGGRDAGAVSFDAVDDQGDAARGDGIVIEEAGE